MQHPVLSGLGVYPSCNVRAVFIEQLSPPIFRLFFSKKNREKEILVLLNFGNLRDHSNICLFGGGKSANKKKRETKIWKI